MKKGIHPKFVESTITCACGNVIQTKSVKPALRVELCSRCHPFFTGQQRIVDTGGKVERFMRRLKAAEEAEKSLSSKKSKMRGVSERRPEATTEGAPEATLQEPPAEEASEE